jgi:hypothetical protein
LEFLRVFGTKRQKPGFPLQFLVLASQALRDFRFNPSRPTGFSGFGTTSRNKNTPKMKKRR